MTTGNLKATFADIPFGLQYDPGTFVLESAYASAILLNKFTCMVLSQVIHYIALILVEFIQ